MKRWKDRQNNKTVIFSLASEKFRQAKYMFLGILFGFYAIGLVFF